MQLLSNSSVSSSALARNLVGTNGTGFVGAFLTTTDLGLIVHASTTNGTNGLLAVSESKLGSDPGSYALDSAKGCGFQKRSGREPVYISQIMDLVRKGRLSRALPLMHKKTVSSKELKESFDTVSKKHNQAFVVRSCHQNQEALSSLS